MTQNLEHKPHVQVKPNLRNQRQSQLRDDADAILRDVAFVLKMTKRVRDEIEAEEEAREPISV